MSESLEQAKGSKLSAIAQAALNRTAEFVKQTGKDIYEDCAPVVTAMGRQGAGELGNFFARPFADSFGPVDAVGTPFHPTQMQVSQEVGLYGEAPSTGNANLEPVAEQPTSASAVATMQKDAEPDLEP